MFLAVPLAIFLVLCALPPGKPAILACVAVIVGALAIFVVVGQGSIMSAHAPLAVAAAILAGAVQRLRSRLDWQGLRSPYPVAVGVGFLGLGVLIVRLLGI